MAAGWHAGNAAYSTPVGNESAHSFSSTAWAVGDFYQFAVSTLGFQNVTVACDQTGSATGPRDFRFSFSTDGVSFTPVGLSYIVLTNGTSANNEGSGKSTSVWSSGGSQQSAYALTFDLSATNSLANQPMVYFRLTVADGAAENGASIGPSGTDRVDLVKSHFSLQSAPDATGTYTNIPGAANPYTDPIGAQQKFYRLIYIDLQDW